MSGMMLAFAGGSYGAAPVNTVAPAVTGTASFGSTLTTTNGTWTGAPAPTFTYQWQRVTTNISGATSSTYVLVAADVGNTIRCVVKATNTIAPSGVTANSNSTASVAAIAPGAPTIGTATTTGVTTATVAFTAPASNGGATITQYDAVSSPAGGTGTLVQAGSGTISVTGLTGSTNYTFTVKATNSAGQSAASAASNSITTYANFIASIGDPTQALRETVIFGTAFSSTAIYTVGKEEDPATSKKAFVASYTLAGVLNWKKSLSESNAEFWACKCDSAGNLLAIAKVASYIVLFKITSAGAITWQKSFSNFGLGDYANNTLAIDSSDNVYLGGDISAINGFTKINSSGAVVLSRGITNTPTSGRLSQKLNTISVSGSNVFLTCNITSGGVSFGHIIAKWNTSGTYSNAIKVSSGYIFGSTNDSSGNLVLCGVTNTSQNVGYISMLDPSLPTGSPTWQKTLSSYEITNQAVITDSSGDVYAAVQARLTTPFPYRFASVKYNSSGTIQWQRQWYDSVNPTNPNHKPWAAGITAGGSLIISGKFENRNNTGESPTIFNTIVPTDGSLTGSYTNNNASLVYATLSLTTGDGSFSYTDASAFASSTETVTVSTTAYTLSDTTYLTSYITII